MLCDETEKSKLLTNSTQSGGIFLAQITMHCLNFDMLGPQRPRQSSSSNVLIEVESAEDGSEKIFNTFDCLKGNVLVSVSRRTSVEKIDITFEGMQLAPTRLHVLTTTLFEDIGTNSTPRTLSLFS